MAALPYMQLYIADYLADTMHLSAEEHGAYLLLMFNYWQTGRAIPKSRLAKIARISNERWGAVEESLREFFIDNGTEWIHERIENDLAAVRDVLAKKSAAGKASVQSRRNRKKTQAASGGNTCSTGVGSVFKQEANKKGTNKDIDLKELNPTHNACARASAPVSQPGIMEQPVVTEPEYREGLNEPIGKFSMMDDWHPSLDFRQRAAQWGVALPEPEYLPTELVAFRDYWTSEGKVFTQIQWEQKFARHVNHVRAKAKPASRRKPCRNPARQHRIAGSTANQGSPRAVGTRKRDRQRRRRPGDSGKSWGKFIRTDGRRRTARHLQSCGWPRLGR